MAPEIKLKLLSGGNVILANCLGYESELFVPVLINNRIVLQNAVASRRCCNRESIVIGNALPKNNVKIFIKKSPSSQLLPLANSTPTNIIKPTKLKIINSIDSVQDSSKIKIPSGMEIKPLFKSQENITKPILNTSENSLPPANFNCSSLINRLPSPDIVRRAPVQFANDNSLLLPTYPQVTSVKIMRLHRANTPNTPKNLAKIIRAKTPLTKTSSPRILRNLSNLSSFGTPPSLHKTKELNSNDCATPNQSFLNRVVKAPNTATKWRKCITPIRTYVRQSRAENPVTKSSNLQSQLPFKNEPINDQYRVTKKSTSKVIIKRRLIIDNNKKITPRKFKKQLTNTEDLNRNEFELPKSRRNFINSQMTAFDLLTNSGFYPKIGRQLNSLFRKGCLNKHTETILKYQQLTKDIPLLEEWN